MNKVLLRTCTFRPYIKFPIFTLKLWDLEDRVDGKWRLGYKLLMKEHKLANSKVLFEGEEYYCSPCHAVDSNDTIVDLMGWLTLRKGDTDSEYFKKYTKEQLEFSKQHAEYLNMEVQSRYCDENGRVTKKFW
jgi:hypothetical protein